MSYNNFQDWNFNNLGDAFTTIANKIEFIKNLFQNKCEVNIFALLRDLLILIEKIHLICLYPSSQMCVKENVASKIFDITSQIRSGIQTLSKLQRKRDSIKTSIDEMVILLSYYLNYFLYSIEKHSIFFCR